MKITQVLLRSLRGGPKLTRSTSGVEVSSKTVASYFKPTIDSQSNPPIRKQNALEKLEISPCTRHPG